jgi:cytoskeletal protein RodZ
MTKETIGSKLKKLRLEKGLTLEEVQKRTKVHLGVLKAIEEDSLINLNPVYTRGFLKIYCKALGADPRSIIPDYKETKTEVQLKPKIALEEKRFFGVFKPRIKIKIKPLIIGLGIIVIALSLFNFIKFISHWHKEKAALWQQQQPSVVFSKAHAPASSVIRLVISARDNCYINLKADGKMLFQGMLKKGRSDTWQAKEKIEFSLGNAGAVSLIVNGKQISNLGKRGQALKNITVTKEGLSIKR